MQKDGMPWREERVNTHIIFHLFEIIAFQQHKSINLLMVMVSACASDVCRIIIITKSNGAEFWEILRSRNGSMWSRLNWSSLSEFSLPLISLWIVLLISSRNSVQRAYSLCQLSMQKWSTNRNLWTCPYTLTLWCSSSSASTEHFSFIYLFMLL